MINLIIKEDIENIVAEIAGELKKFKGKTILISGANGFLPAYIVETLLFFNTTDIEFNVNVIALVRNSQKAQKKFEHHLDNKYLKIVQHDICNEYFTDEKIDYIIHAASQASPKYFGIDPVGTLNANVLGTINLIKLAHLKKVESFLFFSSGEVYGEVPIDKYPIAEDTFGYINPMNVRSCYAESKRMGENICASWHHQYSVKVKIVRPFHTYGPGLLLDDGRVFADFVSDIVSKRNIQLKSEGAARRAFCYLSDATKAFILILLNGENGEAYNVGNPNEEYSILELANIMVDIKPELGLKVIKGIPDKNYVQSPLSKNSPKIDKINKAIGWVPLITVKEGFKRTIESF